MLPSWAEARNIGFPRPGTLTTLNLRSPSFHLKPHVAEVGRDELVRALLDLSHVDLRPGAQNAPESRAQIRQTPLVIGHRTRGRPLRSESHLEVFGLDDVDRLDSLRRSSESILRVPLPGLSDLLEVSFGFSSQLSTTYTHMRAVQHLWLRRHPS